MTISLVVHSVIIVALFFFAAREGMLGKQLKKIAVTMAPKEKPPEKPKEKPPEPKAEPPKEETKVAAAPKVEVPPVIKMAAPPPSAVAPAVAPPPSALAGLDFNDGGKIVQSSSDPAVIYKGLVEYALRSRWVRPDQVLDDNFVAEVEVAIDSTGKITGHDWKKGSGDDRWDQSVKKALAQTKTINRAPPKNFPEKFLVRFDVQPETEPLISASAK